MSGRRVWCVGRDGGMWKEREMCGMGGEGGVRDEREVWEEREVCGRRGRCVEGEGGVWDGRRGWCEG